jgi:hypothetical protein
MAQVQTKTYSRITSSDAQKFASKAYFLKMNVSKAVSMMKQKISKLSSQFSSHSQYSIAIQEALDRDYIKRGNVTGFRSFLPIQ